MAKDCALLFFVDWSIHKATFPPSATGTFESSSIDAAFEASNQKVGSKVTGDIVVVDVVACKLKIESS